MLIATLLIIVVILLVVTGALIKALMIQAKKNEFYEAWITDLQNRVTSIQATMIALDNRQMFSKDDEVGAVFTQMVDLVKALDK